jgi:hypothetical protein
MHIPRLHGHIKNRGLLPVEKSTVQFDELDGPLLPGAGPPPPINQNIIRTNYHESVLPLN